MTPDLLRLTASASPIARIEASAARRAAILMRDARDRATAILADGYRPRGAQPEEYDVSFARSRKASLEREIDGLERDLARWLESDVSDGASQAVADLSKVAKLPLRLDRGAAAVSIEQGADQIRAAVGRIRISVRALSTRAASGSLSHARWLIEVRKAMAGADAIDSIQRLERLAVDRGYQQQRAALERQIKDAGSDLIKVWRTMQDDRVRDSHEKIEGQERELGDAFNVGESATAETGPRSKRGHRCNGPLDPTLPPGEQYNCRCWIEYRKRSDAEHSYIKQRPGRAKASEDSMVVRILPFPTSDRLVGAFDPNQPRDDQGEWTDVGFSGRGGIDIERKVRAEVEAKGREWSKKNKPEKKWDGSLVVANYSDAPGATLFLRDPAAKSEVTAQVADGMAVLQSQGRPIPKAGWELRVVDLASIKPSQTGEDYDNASSRALSNLIAVHGLSGRKEDYRPIIVDERMQILDGNHRHAARKGAGIEKVLALVPKSVRVGASASGKGRVERARASALAAEKAKPPLPNLPGEPGR